MTTINLNNPKNDIEFKCGKWYLIDRKICVLTQIDSGKAKLIAISDNDSNRLTDKVYDTNGRYVVAEIKEDHPNMVELDVTINADIK